MAPHANLPTVPTEPKREKRPFWDRFDIHIKRWQAFFALIVALGVIVGFVGSKMQWHWPSFEDDAENGAGEEIFTRVRYLDREWTEQIQIGGARPVFQVYAGYRNVTDETTYDVVLNLEYDGRLVPVPGTGMLTNTNNPDGKPVGDGVVTVDGVNVGHYDPRATAFVNYSFTLNADNFPCGDTQLTMRSLVRFGDMEIKDATYSPEAIVSYRRKC